MSDKEKVLECMYKHDVNIMVWFPIPATWISKVINVSLFKTRKILHELKKQGLVEFIRGYQPDRFSYEGELEEEAFFYCGWELTDKGRDNDAFKKIQSDELELINKIWG